MSRRTSIPRKEGDLWTADEIASKYRVTPKHITNLAKKGDIPGIQLGTIWRFDPEEVHQKLIDRSLTIRKPRKK